MYDPLSYEQRKLCNSIYDFEILGVTFTIQNGIDLVYSNLVALATSEDGLI